MTITAIPQPSTGGISLTLTANVTHRLRSLVRTDANGSRPVRLLAGQDLSGGSLIVVDHEAALTGPVLYRAATATVAAPSVLTHHSVTTALTGLVLRDRIASAVRPATGVSPLAVKTLTATHPTASAVHTVIGRPDALVSLGVQGMRQGTITILCDTYADARALIATCGAGEILLWRQQAGYAGLDMYFTATAVSPSPEDVDASPRQWSVTIEYIEQAAPSDPILGAFGWTVAGLAATGGTVAAVPGIYPTVAALTIGPPA